ncbi:hypothetical protein ACKAV7_012920 [Fusarium commune]
MGDSTQTATTSWKPRPDFTRINTTPGNKEKLDKIEEEFKPHGASFFITDDQITITFSAAEMRPGGHSLHTIKDEMEKVGLMTDWKLEESRIPAPLIVAHRGETNHCLSE